MTAPTTDLHISIEPPLAFVAVNRPEVRNALSYDLAGRMLDVMAGLDADPRVRAIVLTGTGERAFISGADVTEFRERLATAEGALAFDARLEALAHGIERLGKPVIAMIQGAAVGSGLLLALACDFRIAAEGTKFGVPVARIGLVPSLPDLNRLVRFAGLAAARRLLFTAAIIDAAEAKATGLVDVCVKREALEETVRALAGEMATRAPLAIAAMKEMLAGTATAGRSVAEAEALYRTIYGSRDFAEGVTAFMAKREPVFEGR